MSTISKDQQLVLLLKAHATQQPPEESLFSETDWLALLQESYAQTVVGPVLSGVLMLPSSLHPPEEIKAAWQKRVMADALGYGYHFESQQRFCSLLEEHGIPVALFKGLAVARWYPEPELRALGDLDVLIPENRVADAISLLEENGYEVGEGRDNPLSKHIAVHKNKTEIELHRRVDSLVDSLPDYADACFANRQQIDTPYGILYTLGDTEHGLALVVHLLGHFIKSGFGMRHLYDWTFFMRQAKPDWDKLHAWCRRLSADDFMDALTTCCVRYFGLSVEEVPWKLKTSDEVADALLLDVLSGGNWGRKIDARYYSKFCADALSEKPSAFGRFKRRFAILNDHTQQHYPVTQRYKVLLPMFWLPTVIRLLRRVSKGAVAAPTPDLLRSAQKIAGERGALFKAMHLPDINV